MLYLRLLVSLASTLLILICLLFFTISASPDEVSEANTERDEKSTIAAYFSLRNPAAFFISTATISLTDDNSTYFAARPAAFGPLLPSQGLSGEMWIGSGFGKTSSARRGFISTTEGELGCRDVSRDGNGVWRPDFETEGVKNGGKRRGDATLAEYASEDNILDTRIGIPSGPWIWSEQDGSESEREERRFLRESAEISGKVTLLSRGGCGFSDKVMWAQRRGAAAVIVGDNLAGGPLVRMYARGDTSNITIPSLFTSRTTAHLLSHLIPDPDASRSGVGRSDELDWHTSAAGSPASRRSSKGNNEKRNPLESRGPSGEDSSSLSDAQSRTEYREESPPPHTESTEHQGLWVTLTPTDMNTSPFFNTLFVLVVSPLITLAVVYSMLLLRSRIRRRRWRAPKSVVDRLPVRIYRALSTRSRSGSDTELPEDERYSAKTPLLTDLQSTNSALASSPRDIAQTSPASSTRQYGSLESTSNEQEKIRAGLSEWRRLYGDKQVECVVCLEEYVDGVSKVMSLPCGHEFHVDCITPWLTTRRRTCPICKGDVVRSMSRRSRPNPVDASLETEYDVQVQAVESRNNSPSSALPVPVQDSGSDPEQGDPSPSSVRHEAMPSSSWIARHFNRSLGFVNAPRSNGRSSRGLRSNRRR